MKGKKIEQLYKSHAENTAPDMDALWERIESGLEEKSETGITSKPVRRKISMTRTTALTAACIAALIIVPVAVRNLDITNESMSTEYAENAAPEADEAYEQADGDGYYDEAAGAVAEEEVYENAAEEEYAESTEAIVQTVNYEELALKYAEAPQEIPSGATSGDDYFVEANVLIETDVIVNAYIDSVYSSGDGAMCYNITADNIETGETESIFLVSATPYVMLESRSYVLFLKNDGGEYALAFENAPQIELTLDGGMIFHNGWETLDENAADVIYPQGRADDFFYDRMKFSYTADMEKLVDKWHELTD